MSKNATPWVKRFQKAVKSNQESITDVSQWKYWLMLHGQHRTKEKCVARHCWLLQRNIQHTHQEIWLVQKNLPLTCTISWPIHAKEWMLKLYDPVKKTLKSKRSHISVWQPKVCRSMIRSWSAQKMLRFEKDTNMDWNTKLLECTGIWKHQSSKFFYQSNSQLIVWKAKGN